MGLSVKGILMTICSNGHTFAQDGHHGKKTFKNLLLQNQESFEAESWYTASGTEALLIFFK